MLSQNSSNYLKYLIPKNNAHKKGLQKLGSVHCELPPKNLKNETKFFDSVSTPSAKMARRCNMMQDAVKLYVTIIIN